MTEDEAGAFLRAAREDRYYPVWVALLTAGIRPSEAAGLLWRDVDLKKGTLHIRRTLTRRGLGEGKGWKLEHPKTKKARRSIRLAPVAVEALREWRVLTAKERLLAGAEYLTKPDFVFCSAFGKPIHIRNLYARAFRRTMQRAGLGTWEGEGRKRRFVPSHRMYDLRHTCATTLLKQGVPVKMVSELLGHRKVAFTMDVYQHVLPDMRSTTADVMQAVFGT
jgi:integrase